MGGERESGFVGQCAWGRLAARPFLLLICRLDWEIGDFEEVAVGSDGRDVLRVHARKFHRTGGRSQEEYGGAYRCVGSRLPPVDDGVGPLAESGIFLVLFP